ncbi:MAG: efflux RND transporter periplasmic adaptor subunit [Aquabacterium sp.]|uniref:efflux RND transporter periplasmic adaptor subunit n=1 Tax=Aquabacterium sp. TaxID=1872578 RepID=UPI003BD28A34
MSVSRFKQGRRAGLVSLACVLWLAMGSVQAQQARPKPAGNISCLIQPSQEVNVGTPVDGVLETVNVDRGDIVSQGQLLARLNAGVESAAVDFQSAKAEFGARKHARNADLQRKQLISTQEFDELETEYKLSELELRQRREQLKLRSIVSPIRGVVVDVYRQRGDLVRQEKIFRVVQLQPLHVETVLPAALFGKLRVDQVYDVSPELGGGPFKAKISQIDRVIDAASGTFRVRLLLQNPRLDIPPGQRCAINFPL